MSYEEPKGENEVAGTLWPDSTETQALASLRMALTDLRSALGPAAERLSSASIAWSGARTLA